MGAPIKCSELERTLQKFPMLTDLQLVGRVTSNQLALLAQTTKLKTLDLSRCKGITRGMRQQLSNMSTIQQLQELKMSLNRFELIETLQTFPQLTHIRIVGDAPPFPYLAGELDLWVDTIVQANNLKVLDFSNCIFSNSEVDSLIRELGNHFFLAADGPRVIRPSFVKSALGWLGITIGAAGAVVVSTVTPIKVKEKKERSKRKHEANPSFYSPGIDPAWYSGDL